MTIQEAISRAIEGGYPSKRAEDLALHVQAQYFLETSFWQALGRTLGWEGHGEYIQLSEQESHTISQPMWLSYWHRFNDHLAAGKTPESFFATL